MLHNKFLRYKEFLHIQISCLFVCFQASQRKTLVSQLPDQAKFKEESKVKQRPFFSFLNVKS